MYEHFRSSLRRRSRRAPFGSPHAASKCAVVVLSLVMVCSAAGSAAQRARRDARAPAAAPTPTETVRSFYAHLRAARFREALMRSVYRPAIESLGEPELAELRPEFEALAAGVPAEVDITGEQTSAQASTVFVKVANEGKTEVLPIALVREGGRWIVGDRETATAVRKFGGRYFFELRIATHHAEARAMMNRIAQAQLAYSLTHGGGFGDAGALIRENLLPEDVAGADSLGYRYRITLAPDRKSFSAAAEPTRYDRTGRLSFSIDARGLRAGDARGKPLIVSDGAN